MISILSGKIGAGKTLHAVEMMYEALCEGRTVCTNVELIYKQLAILAVKEKSLLIKRSQIIQLDLNTLANWHTEIPWGVTGDPTLVCLDEIHLWFNSRDYAKTDNLHRDMLSFLSQSRKAAVDVIFIAQEINNIEKQFRAQAKHLLFISDFGGFYLPILGKVPLQQNVITTRDADTKMILRRQKRQYPKKMFGCYETLAMLDTQMQEASKLMERQKPIHLVKIKKAKGKSIIQMLKEDQNLDSMEPENKPSKIKSLLTSIKLKLTKKL